MYTYIINVAFLDEYKNRNTVISCIYIHLFISQMNEY